MASEVDESSTKKESRSQNGDEQENGDTEDRQIPEEAEQDEAKEGPEGNRGDGEQVNKEHSVNLSQVQNRYNTKNHSSMKSILTEYGMPNPQKKHRKVPRKPKQKKPADKDLDSEDDTENDRQKAKREHNLRVFNEVQMLRDCYYDMYMNKLRDKVENQRVEIRKKSEELENKMKAKQERQKRDSHMVKKRLERHTLTHNEDFVNKVPKSDYYKILALQNKLKSQGQLHTQEELDQFWKDVRNPSMLHKYLQIYKPLPMDPSVQTYHKSASMAHTPNQQSSSHARSRTSSTSSFAPPDKNPQEFRPMTQIEETRETSRPATRDQMAESPVQKPREPPAKKRERDPYTIAKMAAADLDKKFPQMELPPMSCFAMEMGEEVLEPDEVLKSLAADRRSKERKLFVKRLRRMYHLSQSNTATAQRILSGQHDDETEDLYSPNIGDIIAIDEINQGLDEALGRIRPPRPPEQPRPWNKHLTSPLPHNITTIPEETSRARSATSATSKKSRTVSAGSRLEKKDVVPVPLSLDLLVQEKAKTMEPKCMSTMWTNYLNVGKSKFAPVESR